MVPLGAKDGQVSVIKRTWLGHLTELGILIKSLQFSEPQFLHLLHGDFREAGT
jgi:hypothetical protein